MIPQYAYFQLLLLWYHHCSWGVPCSWISWDTLTYVSRKLWIVLHCKSTNQLPTKLRLQQNFDNPYTLTATNKNDSTVFLTVYIYSKGKELKGFNQTIKNILFFVHIRFTPDNIHKTNSVPPIFQQIRQPFYV